MKQLLFFLLILPLSGYAQKDIEHFLVINPKGHKSIIYDMRIDPQGRIVTGSFDKSVFAWSVELGKIEKTFIGQIGIGAEGMVYTCDVSPDGKYLAVAGWMGKDDETENLGDIRIYNYETGKLRKRLKYHEDAVKTVRFTSDSNYLVSCDASGVVVRWSMSRMIHETIYTRVNESCENLALADNYFVTSHPDGMVYKWEYDKYKPAKKLPFFTKLKSMNVGTEVAVSDDGTKIGVAGKEVGMILILNEKLSLEQHFFTGNNSIVTIAFAPSGERLAVSLKQEGKTIVKIYDFDGAEWQETGLEKYDDLVSTLIFKDDNTLYVAGGRGNQIYINEVSKKGNIKEVKRMSGEGRVFYSANLVDTKLAFSTFPTKAYGRSEYTMMFDLFERKLMKEKKDFSEFKYPERFVDNWRIWEYDYLRMTANDPSQVLLIEKDSVIADSIIFHPWDGDKFYTYALINDDLIAVGGSYGIFQVHDRKGKLLTRLVGHEDGLRSVCLSSDGKFLVTSSVDMTIRFWPMKEVGKMNGNKPNEVVPTASMFITEDNEWVLWNQAGYFTASKKGARFVGYHVNQGKNYEAKFYPFDQFDLKFNRPDILMNDLKVADDGIIELYRMAYLKRLERMGIKEEDLSGDIHTPQISKIQTKKTDNHLHINIRAEDDIYTLNRLNIYVNDVPILGRNGLSIKGDLKTFSYEQDVELIDGKNKVEVSVLNSVGVESLRETVYINHHSEQKSDLYIAALGVSNYQDANFNLNYAAKDAEDVIQAISQQQIYDYLHTKLLTNEEVTKKNLFDLKKFFASAKTNDVVIMFIAGHGVLDVKLDYFFCTYDMDFQNPALYGVSYHEIEVLFDGIKAIKKLLIMDTCHSGELFKDEVEEVELDTELQGDDVVFRSNQGTTTVRTRQGLQKTNEAVREMFNDLNRGTGTTVISSAGGVEYAMESAEWKNGLFTFCLLDGLKGLKADENKDGKVFLSELQEYIGLKVFELSNGKQKPTARFENLSLDYQIW